MEQILEQYHKRNASELNVFQQEVYRYLGYGKNMPEGEIKDLIEKCIIKVIEEAVPQSVYSLVPIKSMEEELDLTYGIVSSDSLKRNLAGCTHTILFAATIGPKVDMLIARYSKIDPLNGVIFQAVGAAVIEAYCDSLNNQLKEELNKEGYSLKPRFSPGYGDLPLSFQKDIFQWLQGAKKIGLTLMDSLIMAPSKSVTAIIGITSCKNKIEEQESCDCKKCEKKDCEYRV